jgi:single-stranded DNA-specific DHH superfamily exonuclease
MTGDGTRAIVLAHEDWHPGVVGIVCSRLVERFARPAILMQRRPARADEGWCDGLVCTGSGRSIDGFDLHGAVGACAEHLEGFGGHDMAIGLRLDAEPVRRVRRRVRGPRERVAVARRPRADGAVRLRDDARRADARGVKRLDV